MLKTFDIQAKDKLNRVKPSNNLWIQLVNPSQNELERIAKDFLIPFSMLNMHQSDKRSTAIERHSDLFAFVIELPIANEASSKVPFSIMKLSIIVIGDVVITIADQAHPILEDMQKEYAALFSTMGVTSFVNRIFELTTGYFLISIAQISDIVDEVEHRLQVSISNKQVFDLLNNNKSYLFFIRSLKHNGIILDDLAKKRLLASDHRTDVQMIDIIVANQQTQKKAEIYNANLRNLMDAYSAAIENNLSLAVQYLTIFVTIAAIPMAVAGIYGMNTPLPFQDEPYALAALAGITVAIAVAVISFFKVRRYI